MIWGPEMHFKSICAWHTVYFLPKKMSSVRRILGTILGAIFRFLKTKFDSYNRSQANPS